MNIKNILIAGSIAAMLAATGCSGQASARNNPARNLTNSANRAYGHNYNNTYGYGHNNYSDRYDNYGNYTADGYFINDYVIENDPYAANYYGYGRTNPYSGVTGYSYDNTWNPSIDTIS